VQEIDCEHVRPAPVAAHPVFDGAIPLTSESERTRRSIGHRRLKSAKTLAPKVDRLLGGHQEPPDCRSVGHGIRHGHADPMSGGWMPALPAGPKTIVSGTDD